MEKINPIPFWRDLHTIIFDFDGIFTNNYVYLDQNGKESVRCDRGDGLGFDILRKFILKNLWDVEYFILSKEKNPVVLQRAEKLKLKAYKSIINKEEYIKNYLNQRFGNFEESKNGVLFLGNDLNDLASIKFCGHSIAPSDAHELIKKNASLVLSQRGGHGFVRAAIEKIINLENMSLEEIYNLI